MVKEEAVIQFILDWLSSNKKIADNDTARQKVCDFSLRVFLDFLDVLDLFMVIEERYCINLEEIIGHDSIPDYKNITPAGLAKAVARESNE